MEASLPVDLADCKGIPSRLQITKSVILFNDVGHHVAKGVCQSMDSNLVLECDEPLNDDFVALQISSSLHEADVPKDRTLSLHAWPIKLAIYNSRNLYDHDRQDQFHNALAQFHAYKGVPSYNSQNRGEARTSTLQMQEKLSTHVHMPSHLHIGPY